jgi:hypothetical protein
MINNCILIIQVQNIHMTNQPGDFVCVNQNKYKTKFALLFKRMSLPTSTDKKETQNFPPK